MKWGALLLVVVACRPGDPETAPGPHGPNQAAAWVAPKPAPPTIAEPIRAPAASQGGWVQEPIGEPLVDPMNHAELLAIGARTAIARTDGGLVALHAERGVVGKLRLPLGWFWLGLDDRDALYVATPEGALYRSDDATSSADATFAPLAQIDGASAWDVAGSTVVAVRGAEVLVSRDRGASYLTGTPAQALTVRRVRARPDGVVVAWGHDPSGSVTHLSNDGVRWALSSFQPHEIARVGGVITNTSDGCPVSLARDGSWVRGRPDPRSEAAWLAMLRPSRAPHAAMRSPFLSQLAPAEPAAADAMLGHEQDCKPFARALPPLETSAGALLGALPLPPVGPGRCRGVNCMRGVATRTPALPATFGLVAGGKVAAVDRRGGFATIVDPPCPASRVLSMRGAGVMACPEGEGLQLYSVARDGRFYREQAFAWPPEALRDIDNGDDATAVLSCAVEACSGRALVRSPNPLGTAAWREVAIDGAVMYRALLLGAALAMTSPADADTGKEGAFGKLQPGDLLGGDDAQSVAERTAEAEKKLHQMSFVIARNDGTTRPMATDLHFEGDVAAIDVVDGGVYVSIDQAGASSVHRMDSGKMVAVKEAPSVLQVAIAPSVSVASHAIALDDTHVYWTDAARGLVLRVDRQGGAPQTLASGQHGALAIAVDATHAYFTVAGHYSVADGAVRRVPKQGTGEHFPIEEIASGQLRPEAIALDPSAVFWTSRGYAGALDGAVLRWLKSGGEPAPLAVGLAEPTGIALAQNDVYFAVTAAGSIMRVQKRGGPLTRVIGDQLLPQSLAVDELLTWSHAGGVRRAPLSDPTRAVTVRAASAAIDAASCGDAFVISDALGAMLVRGDERVRLLRSEQPPGAIACDGTTAYLVLQGGQRIDAVDRNGGTRTLTRAARAVVPLRGGN